MKLYDYESELNKTIAKERYLQRQTAPLKTRADWNKYSDGSKAISNIDARDIFDAYMEYKQNCNDGEYY